MPGPADRVRHLIRDSKMSQHEFAVAIGLDDSKLSKSLSGSRRFSSADLARIAELGGVTVDWLITGDGSATAIAARTTSGIAGTALDVAGRLATMRSELSELGYPQPWNAVVAPPATGTWAQQGAALAAQTVELIRAAGREASESDLAGVVEEVFGADVAVADLDAGFDGLAASSDEVKLIVLGRTTVPGRQRFTLAHELGHLLAGDDQGVHLDQDIFDKTQQRQPTEKRANAFASALLMPEVRLRAAVGRDGLDEIGFAALSCDLAVSPSTLAYRLLALRLIDAGTCERLRRMTAAAAAQRAGRTEEWVRRVSTANTPRPPGLLLRDAYAAYDSGATTLGPYASLLGVDVSSLRSALETDAESGRAM